MKPKLLIHGGCGKYESDKVEFKTYHTHLTDIVSEAYGFLLNGQTALETVRYGIRLLENDSIFNAGTGSKLQADGVVRMSAALMSGNDKLFTSVINIEEVKNPIDVAYELRSENYHVLTGKPALIYARDKGYDYWDPKIDERVEEFEKKKKGETATVGVIALDAQGYLCAGSSTGGIGFELPGRVGDTPTVAGTYCTEICGVCCTGIGEDLLNQAAAVRTVTRVEEGLKITDAIDKIVQEGQKLNQKFGLIAMDRDGNFATGNTKTIQVLYAFMQDKYNTQTFFSL